jgi:hypothetical protein
MKTLTNCYPLFMRDFEKVGNRAAALALPARILYTVFAVLVMAGCLSCVSLYDRMVHFEAHATPLELYQRLVDHHRTIDRQKLVETSHAHLFIMPVLLLVAGHLFLLCSASPRLKLVAIIVAATATTLHLVAPWLIVWTDGAMAATLVYPISGGLLLISTAVLLGVPVWQMWS